MNAHSRSRSLPVLRDLLLAVLVAGLSAVAVPAHAYLAPATPTFQLKWGSTGLGPGQFLQSRGIAFDSDGNVYSCDLFSHRIQKFDPLGNFIAQWGTFGPGPGQFQYPIGIAIDATDNVYVTDWANQRIQKFTRKGSYLTSWPFSDASSGLAVKSDGTVYACNGEGIRRFSPTGVDLGLFQTGPYYQALAFDAAGFLYAGVGYQLWKFGPGGEVYWNVGSPGSGNLQFDDIAGLTVDAVGNAYVCDRGNYRIQKITSDGVWLAQWGGYGAGDGQFTYPSAIGVDPAGYTFVADGDRIQRFSGAGDPFSFPQPFFWAQWGSGGGGGGQFNGPVGMTVLAPKGARYTLFNVVDQGNHRVHRFRTYQGVFYFDWTWGSQGTGNGQFQTPWGIAGSPDALSVYVTDALNHRVQRFDSNGGFLSKWGASGTGPGQFNTPTGIACDTAGYVYVADGGNCRVQKFTASGTYVTSWGSVGSGAGQFNFVTGVAVDTAGLVYACDYGNGRIQKFSSAGEYLGEWGTPGSGPGQMIQPYGVAIDRYGNVIVTDSGNNRLQMFTSNGTLLAQCGSGGGGAGQFNLPVGVCTDPVGNAFVTDNNNNRVQQIGFSPRVLAVSDVKNDQGGQARVRIGRATVDAAGISGGAVQYYRTYYRTDPAGNWVVAYDAFATGEPEYNVIAPIPETATSSSWSFAQFKVAAYLPGLNAWIDSDTGSGFAVDNLTPPPPNAFAATSLEGSVRLSWETSPVPDFKAFRLYRGASADFHPAAKDLVVETTGTSHVVATAGGSAYKLSAVDTHGNESGYAVATGGAAETVAEARLALRGALQNPARAERCEISFSLADASPAQLEMFDVAGRRVFRRDVGVFGPGWHSVCAGCDARIASGIYHLRLVQAGQTLTARVVLFD